MKTQIKTHLRWMVRRDMPEVFAIEAVSFSNPWSEDDFFQVLRARTYMGMVAEHVDQVVGFMIYELSKDRIEVSNFAVPPEMRRCRIGTQMVRKLIGRLSPQRRTKLSLQVRESNLSAQLFFQSQGFRAVSILHEYYDCEDPPEDAYVMEKLSEP